MARDRSIEQIRERLDLVELIGTHTALKPVGRRFTGLCPFHQERTPSFSVDPERGFYHCFGCGAGGDAFRFVMETEGKTFPEALESLARRTGVELERERRIPPAARSRRVQMLAVTRQAAAFFERTLASDPAGAPARAYLESRGLSLDRALARGLGAAPDAWEGLARHLGRERADLRAAEACGLVSERNTGGWFDRFRARLTFTIHDVDGQPIGFGARRLGDGDGPKYLNSSDSDVFHKGKELYGLDRARKAMRDRRRAILVEGYFDVISMHEAGFEETVAPLGTAVTFDHAARLRRYTDEVLLLFDGDDAGRAAALRALPHFLKADVRARVVFLPSGEDPDTLVRQGGGQQQLAAWIEDAPPLLDHLVDAGVERAGDDPRGRAEVARELGPLIETMPDPVEREASLARLAERLGISTEGLRGSIERASRRSGPRPPVEVPATGARRASVARIRRTEADLVRQLVAFPELANDLAGADVVVESPACQRFLDAARDRPGAGPASWVEEAADEELVGLAAEAAVAPEPIPGDTDPRRLFADHLTFLRRTRLEDEASRIQREIAALDPVVDAERLRALQARKVELRRATQRGPAGRPA